MYRVIWVSKHIRGQENKDGEEYGVVQPKNKILKYKISEEGTSINRFSDTEWIARPIVMQGTEFICNLRLTACQRPNSFNTDILKEEK